MPTKPTAPPSQDHPPTDFLPIPDVAARLGLSVRQTYRHIQAGEIPVVRMGRTVRVPASAFESWLGGRGHGEIMETVAQFLADFADSEAGTRLREHLARVEEHQAAQAGRFDQYVKGVTAAEARAFARRGY